MGKELRKVGNLLINKNWKRGKEGNEAFDKVLSDILNERLKVKNEKPKNKKKKKKKKDDNPMTIA